MKSVRYALAALLVNILGSQLCQAHVPRVAYVQMLKTQADSNRLRELANRYRFDLIYHGFDGIPEFYANDQREDGQNKLEHLASVLKSVDIVVADITPTHPKFAASVHPNIAVFLGMALAARKSIYLHTNEPKDYVRRIKELYGPVRNEFPFAGKDILARIDPAWIYIEEFTTRDNLRIDACADHSHSQVYDDLDTLFEKELSKARSQTEWLKFVDGDPQKVFLGGPFFLHRDAEKIGKAQKDIAGLLELQGIFPLDVIFDPNPPSTPPRILIYDTFYREMNQALQCGAAVLDISPFRGFYEDPGTAGLIAGLFYGLKRPVFAYNRILQVPYDFPPALTLERARNGFLTAATVLASGGQMTSGEVYQPLWQYAESHRKFVMTDGKKKELDHLLFTYPDTLCVDLLAVQVREPELVGD